MVVPSSKPTAFSVPSLEPPGRGTGRTPAVWLWLALVVLLAANLPLMVCMPLTVDPLLYDLQAQTALEGGVLYRDLLEPNLPGVVWVHVVVRSVLGWSTCALRAFDLLVFAGIVALLTRMVRRAAPSTDVNVQAPALALLLCWCYFSTSEWAHCQRDVWLMLPAVGALLLRFRQLRRLSSSEAGMREIFLWGGLEGLLWGTAFWIKPFVAVPAAATLITSACLTRKWRESMIDFGGVLFGGALLGGVGSLWLIQTGAWPHFWDMALNWNPGYFEAGRERWTLERYASMCNRFFPWSLVHGVAIPVAVLNLARIRRGRGGDHARAGVCLLSAAYLGWLLQAHVLQHLFDYVHVPAILLGLSLLAAAWPSHRSGLPLARVALASFIFMALIVSPATQPQRLAWWGRCLTEGGTPEVRSGLQHVPLPDWKELQPVIEFLKAQDLRHRELTVYNVFLIHLYPELGLRPSTRYFSLDVPLRIFKDRASLIERELDDVPQRFVVSSLVENGMRLDDIGPFTADQPPRLPPNFPAAELDFFPYNQQLVFRSGQYVVHQVTRPVGTLNTRFFPLERPQRSAGTVP